VAKGVGMERGVQGEEQAKREAATLLGRYGGRARMASMSRAEQKAMQRRGGQARAKRLSRARRRAIAIAAAEARWGRDRTAQARKP